MTETLHHFFKLIRIFESIIICAVASKKNYLKPVGVLDKVKSALSPRIAKLMGSVKLPEDFDYKLELSNALVKNINKP